MLGAAAGLQSVGSAVDASIVVHSRYLASLHGKGSSLCVATRLGAPNLGAFRNQRNHRQRNQRQVARVSSSVEVSATDTENDDYYSILGVPITATQAEIKRAYYSYMREFHPDFSRDSEEATEFAVFINDVYETLSDEGRRAAYDEIAGLSTKGINPFRDTRYEADKVFVDEYTCIGCRNCVGVCSRTFAIEDEHGRARVMAQGINTDEKLQEAIDTCPVSCIHWVTAPQLSLLEDEMAKMERKDAWLLMTGRGSAVNVFLEAARSWEKRRSAARDRARAETSAQRRGFWAGWEPSASASSYEGGASSDEDEQGGNGSRADVRRKTAASVASAARKWRDLRRQQRRKGEEKREKMLLTTSTDED